MKTTTKRAIDAAIDGYQRDIATATRNHAARGHIAGDIAAHKALGMDISFNLVQKEALAYSKPYGELLYREGASIIQGEKIPWLKDHTGRTREKVFTTIRDGLKKGKPVSEIGGKKLGKGTIAYDLKKVMDGEDSGMVRIARTEVARIQSAGSMTRYKINGVKQVRWLCGANPCPICAQYCNKIFDIDDAPEIPVHPNCTCDKMPIIAKRPKKEPEWTDEKIADDLWKKTEKDGLEHAMIMNERIYTKMGTKNFCPLGKLPDTPFQLHHSHPNWDAPTSGGDISSFLLNENCRVMAASSKNNIYKLTKLPETPKLTSFARKAEFEDFMDARFRMELKAGVSKTRAWRQAAIVTNTNIAKKYKYKFEIIPR